jgi:hypothetical protein
MAQQEFFAVSIRKTWRFRLSHCAQIRRDLAKSAYKLGTVLFQQSLASCIANLGHRELRSAGNKKYRRSQIRIPDLMAELDAVAVREVIIKDIECELSVGDVVQRFVPRARGNNFEPGKDRRDQFTGIRMIFYAKYPTGAHF